MRELDEGVVRDEELHVGTCASERRRRRVEGREERAKRRLFVIGLDLRERFGGEAACAGDVFAGGEEEHGEVPCVDERRLQFDGAPSVWERCVCVALRGKEAGEGIVRLGGIVIEGHGVSEKDTGVVEERRTLGWRRGACLSEAGFAGAAEHASKHGCRHREAVLGALVGGADEQQVIGPFVCLGRGMDVVRGDVSAEQDGIDVLARSVDGA